MSKVVTLTAAACCMAVSGAWAQSTGTAVSGTTAGSTQTVEEDASDFTFTESQLDEDVDAAQTISNVASSNNDPYLSNVGFLWSSMRFKVRALDNMYSTTIDEETYCIKPMNCPGGVMVYASKPHSYRELPMRVGELGLVHRHELSGALHGLFRVRCFTQDDAHIFMTPDQIEKEIQKTIDLFDEVYSTFGLTYTAELSTRPELYGTPVVVASSTIGNSGILLALSKEAKQLGLKRGDPIFKIRDRLEKNKVHVFPADLKKYRQISRRLMQTVLEQDILQTFTQYSVDEFFGELPLDDPEELRHYALKIKSRIFHFSS